MSIPVTPGIGQRRPIRVLVTGNLGYLGMPLAARLSAAGYEVIGLDLGLFLMQATEPGIVVPGFQLFADTRAAPSLTFDGSTADVVVHLAGLSNDPSGELDPTLTTEINEMATLRLIRSHRHALHVVASSCAVYGANPDEVDETAPVSPLTAYARSKAHVDAEATRNDPFVPATVVSLRLGTLYGWAPVHRLDTVVNKMVADALRDDFINVNGNAWRPFTHVEDAADAIVAVVEAKVSASGIFNVVGENAQIADVANAISSFTGAGILQWGAGDDRRDYRVIGDKFRRRFGWRPAHTIEGTIPVLAERTLTLDPGREYRRLPIIQAAIDEGRLHLEYGEVAA